MAVLKTTDFQNLTDHILILDEIFNDAQKQSLAKQTMLEVFDTSSNSNRHDTIQLNHGLAGVKYIPENTDYPEATGKEGDIIRFTKYKYGADVILTYENRLYDEYNQVESDVRTIVDEGYNKIDQSLADILGYGFSATSYTDVYGQTASAVGPDGLALFSAVHTNGSTSRTYSNLIVADGVTNPALSRSAIIQTRVAGLKYKDPNGVSRPIYLDVLLVAPEQEDLANRLVGSTQLPGSANNDTNDYLKGKYKIMVSEKLSVRSDGTDTSAYWYMYSSAMVKTTLKSYFAQYPTLMPPAEFDPNKNWHYLFQFIYSRGFSWAPYIYGSNATLS